MIVIVKKNKKKNYWKSFIEEETLPKKLKYINMSLSYLYRLWGMIFLNRIVDFPQYSKKFPHIIGEILSTIMPPQDDDLVKDTNLGSM